MKASSNLRVNAQPRFAGRILHVFGNRANSLRGVLHLGLLLGLLLLSTACNSTTVLQANFNSDTAGSSPASAQATGTVSLSPGAGTIVVVDAPAAGFPA